MQSVVLTALAEPSVLVHELPAEKLEICPHHILPLTLHSVLAPFRSALGTGRKVEANRYYSHGNMLCWFWFFFHLTLPDVV